jgi:DNA-binding CsgD family transcriptional regulator
VTADGEVVALLSLASHVLDEIPDKIRTATEVIAGYIGGIVSRIRLAGIVESQAERLRETSAALKAVLKQREEDRTELEESLHRNVNQLILPYIEKLKKSRLSGDQRNFLGIIESSLREITSAFVTKISGSMIGLSPAEIRVADLIRQGKRSKDIAGLLGISERTVIFHRQGIRRKLDLTAKKINLQTYLNRLL